MSLAACVAACWMLTFAVAARAAEPPQIGALWVTDVTATSAVAHAELNPEGAKTSYHFEYLTAAAYEANLNAGREAFAGALKAPAGSEPTVGVGSAFVPVTPQPMYLSAATSYRYRLLASNSAGAAASAAHSFTTQGSGGIVGRLDNRHWEMVSPIDKNGGQVQEPGEIAGGGVLQAADAGGAITYSSTSSFANGGLGNPGANQYISRRGGNGWATENITAPTLSGAYGEHPNGVPYQLFSPDLARALMLNGEHCRIETSEPCPVANPPLEGSGAPRGFQNYYLRENTSGAYHALVTAAEVSGLSADTFSIHFAGSTPDLSHVILTTCSKLSPEAVEVPGAEGCDPEAQNLYEWSGGGLSLINILPGQSLGTPGATLGAQAGAISTDGRRVYFSDGGSLYLREGSNSYLLTVGGEFQTATPSGGMAFYIVGEHLYRYDASSHVATDLTPSGGVRGMLGASADGSVAFYQDVEGLERWDFGVGPVRRVVAGEDAASESDWPPATGTARVSEDGSEVLFLSKASLTGSDNIDQNTGLPDSELFMWQIGSGLACVSCSPTGERPLGPSTIPGAVSNGGQEGATDLYKPRVLSANGRRVFFNSADALVLGDTNDAPDVYEWEANGESNCSESGGCVALISQGSGGASTFVDASSSGDDAYFLTAASLVDPGGRVVTPAGNVDPGSVDVYDARVNGGYPPPPEPIKCEGDSCQPLPSEPEDPEAGTQRSGPGNPPLPGSRKCKKGYVRKHGRCVHRHHKHHRKHRRHRHRGHGR